MVNKRLWITKSFVVLSFMDLDMLKPIGYRYVTVCQYSQAVSFPTDGDNDIDVIITFYEIVLEAYKYIQRQKKSYLNLDWMLSPFVPSIISCPIRFFFLFVNCMSGIF